MLGIVHVRNRNLMRAPGAFDRKAIDNFGPVQPLGVQNTIIGQRGRSRFSVSPRDRAAALDLADLKQNTVERPGKALMHQFRIVALDEMRVIAVTAQQLSQFLTADPGQHGRIGNLEPFR